jgi:hypothetical protein
MRSPALDGSGDVADAKLRRVPACGTAGVTIAAFLDLDGTLTDPRDGILRSLRYALANVGAFCSADEVLERYIGPPLCARHKRAPA